MKNLLTIMEQGIETKKSSVVTDSVIDRRAARAVLLDENGQVYLLYVGKYDFYKLPGGGVDEGEEIIEALERELLEEVGCRAKIIDELGTVIEYRTQKNGLFRHTSFCYLAEQMGEQVESSLEKEELEDGMVQVKAKDIDEAIQKISKSIPKNIEGAHIQKRDLAFLRSAKKYLDAA